MPIGLTLIHRCAVQRYATAAEGYGSKRTAAAHLSDVHCRLQTKMQRAFNSLSGQWLVTTSYRLLVPYGTDVLAGDRITSVVDEDGNTVAGNWEVAGVLEKRGHATRHKSLELNKVA